jgi:hypothetical protein
MNLIDLLADVVDTVPDVKAHLKPETLEALKNANTYGRQLWKYCLDLYRTGDGGVFLGLFIDAIKNQMTRAWNEGAREVGVDPKEMTDDDRAELKAIIDGEYDQIIKLAEAIMESRSGTLDEFRQKFRSRIDLWVNRYTDVIGRARVYFGGKTRLKWTLGKTEEHCETCATLNGIVAFASEWEQAGIKPQSPPNGMLACSGWNCDCSLEPTDQRRSPNALETLMNIATARNIDKSMKYDPDQPRVPAGDPEGGQWTSEGEKQYIGTIEFGETSGVAESRGDKIIVNKSRFISLSYDDKLSVIIHEISHSTVDQWIDEHADPEWEIAKEALLIKYREDTEGIPHYLFVGGETKLTEAIASSITSYILKGNNAEFTIFDPKLGNVSVDPKWKEWAESVINRSGYSREGILFQSMQFVDKLEWR